ncbi:hypothetical protein [Brachyspira catarrhinii]|uniref:Uncharacterized protein n=1 Tax=Brachyspira catarrhinii TaxID=2528966 RepID=A0ABY2TT90_9SPIR|nr:hypothetical protein [Brachyspira catarrhinii]TKZ35955.1 hypothetical protein EZH24_02555 [Brachyspira catarrhinii]
MSKYSHLWIYIDLIFKRYNKEKIELSFNQIKDAAGFEIDHSFLTYKKELLDYGYKVEKIKLKDKKIIFSKINNDK